MPGRRTDGQIQVCGRAGDGREPGGSRPARTATGGTHRTGRPWGGLPDRL